MLSQFCLFYPTPCKYSTRNAWGGIPYPIPKTGVEPVINHLVRWRGIYRTSTEAQFTVDAKG
ncbi:MAG: DUF1329 domain-containing protein, partial [Deltaproteobacteria bacterium]|nr:DUF1329 domain-containing protein [Deltaproteobacteria bacterium]